jgi:hypothetical protein
MPDTTDELLDVRRAAALVGRHPETVRRWVWSGRLSARREGNRLLVARGEVEALAGNGSRASTSLSEWARRAARGRETGESAGGTAADLVLADRARRAHAGR